MTCGASGTASEGRREHLRAGGWRALWARVPSWAVRVQCGVKQRKARSGPTQNGPMRGRKEGSRRREGGKGGASWAAKRAKLGRGDRKRPGQILGLG